MNLPNLDTSKMTEQELQFHYFKMHDADNNNKLDGCELIKSLIHWHGKFRLYILVLFACKFGDLFKLTLRLCLFVFLDFLFSGRFCHVSYESVTVQFNQPTTNRILNNTLKP